MKIYTSDFKIEDFMDITDVRDGLNPLLRKLFFALKEKLSEDRYANSSRILKDIVGSDFDLVYNLLVNTTYPRSDLPCVMGRGNFGFPPAYPDYSEIKLSEFAKAFLKCSDAEENINTPLAMPIPYEFAFGTSGYCQGKTKIPTHNSGEVIDAMIALVKNPELTTKELLKIIKGPDLLIGGAIENTEELYNIYENGFGNIKVIFTPENYNADFEGDVGGYCDWYELKFRKVYKKEAYRIELPYYAFMNDGEKNELMSLEKILKKHLNYYRGFNNELDETELCDMLTLLKKQSSDRKTYLCDK